MKLKKTKIPAEFHAKDVDNNATTTTTTYIKKIKLNNDNNNKITKHCNIKGDNDQTNNNNLKRGNKTGGNIE